MLNQKTLREHKKRKNNSERLLLGPPKIRRIRKPKKPWENKKTKKQFWGSLEEKGVQPRVSENCFFVVCLFFLCSQVFFCFLFFSDFGGSSQESPRIVLFFVCPRFFGVLLFFFLMCFLSFMHIYQRFFWF